jgi:hypothetical protein
MPSLSSAEESTHARLTLVRHVHHICCASYYFGDDVLPFEDIRPGLEQLDDALILGKVDVSWLVHDQRSCWFATLELKIDFESNIHPTRHAAATQLEIYPNTVYCNAYASADTLTSLVVIPHVLTMNLLSPPSCC